MIPILYVPSALPVATSSHALLAPFYSQFKDITSSTWQKVGCGITSVAMVIDYYTPNAVTPNTLLKEALADDAYDQNAGWKHAGLIHASSKYGFEGASYDLSNKDTVSAFASLKTAVTEGPVIVSVHYKFDPKSMIPHLVVINSVKDDVLVYNDPTATNGQKQISKTAFLKAWKKRFITIRPIEVPHTPEVALDVPKEYPVFVPEVKFSFFHFLTDWVKKFIA